MSQPVQQHYLPKEAYLKFFESPEKDGFVWMYQREKETILVNTKNVAKERHLYSFTEENGKYNTQIESAFAEMEGIASKILEKLNKAQSPIILTSQEKVELSYFLAMQVARTPAFRDSLKQQAVEFTKLHMKMLASNKEIFSKSLNKIKKENPEIPDISVEDMQKFVLGDKYKIEMGNENYFLKQAIQLGNHIYPSIMMKDIIILRSESVELITSDYPVALISDPKIPPFYSGGFLMAGVLIPIATNTALFCVNPLTPQEPPEEGDRVIIGYKKIPAVQGRWINRVMIDHAERFLFGSISNTKIKEIFDKTSVPKRFHMSSPFSN